MDLKSKLQKIVVVPKCSLFPKQSSEADQHAKYWTNALKNLPMMF
jgi:hypothetical protein